MLLLVPVDCNAGRARNLRLTTAARRADTLLRALVQP